MGAAISDTLRQSKELNPRLPQLHLSFCLHLKPAWIHPKPLRSMDSYLLSEFIFHQEISAPLKVHPTFACLASQRSQHKVPHCSCGYVWLFTFEILAFFWSAISLLESWVNWDWPRWFILRVGILHCHTDNVTCIVHDIARACVKVRQKPERSGEWTGHSSKVP